MRGRPMKDDCRSRLSVLLAAEAERRLAMVQRLLTWRSWRMTQAMDAGKGIPMAKATNEATPITLSADAVAVLELLHLEPDSLAVCEIARDVFGKVDNSSKHRILAGIHELNQYKPLCDRVACRGLDMPIVRHVRTHWTSGRRVRPALTRQYSLHPLAWPLRNQIAGAHRLAGITPPDAWCDGSADGDAGG